ncbi:hypothetical protein HU200_059546 [Digitaria exilis]|uniref:Aminotransferase class V domain-containing protein n=1 Tax=Digitaria exilis TaxID=1010633 RepID=A0A835ABM1_9POAL|nr:hypothetical protein HU200_059546 [Digitaria exilis]
MNKALYRLNSQPPSTCGGGTEREDAGTPQIIQKIRASLAFWVKEYIGYDMMSLRERVYSETAMKRLVSNPNVRVLGNTTVERLPIFSFLIYPPVSNSGDVKHKRLPLHGRPYGHTLLEIDNDLSLRIRSMILEEEFKFILAAIEFIASYGHRFLSLYKFNWITGDWTFRKQAIKYQIMKEELDLTSGIEPLAENAQAKEDIMPAVQAVTVPMAKASAAEEDTKGMATLLSLLRATTLEESAAAAVTAAGDEEEKVEWLRSQLIGKDVEFDTPFGRRVLTYADQTASGRSLRYIEDYLINEVLPFYGNTHTEDSHVGSKTTRLVHKASRYVKRCMGAGASDALLFCGAGTTAAIKRLQEVMGVASPSAELRERLAAQLRTEERWVVFVGPYEHHSNLLSWRRSIADVVEIGVDADGLVDVAALRRALTSPEFANRPMLGSFSACSNVTGVMTDTRQLARVLHEHGAFACFDFAAR